MNNIKLNIIAGEAVLRKSLTSAPDGRPMARRVFFAADSWQVEDEFLPLLSAHASYLSENTGLVAVVAGHCQGTQRQRRCWLLGERRSRSVVHALVAAGVNADQIAGVSKGVMRPSIECDDKTANFRRRVNIEYVKADELNGTIVVPAGAPTWWKRNTAGKRAALLKSKPRFRGASRGFGHSICAVTEQAWLA